MIIPSCNLFLIRGCEKKKMKPWVMMAGLKLKFRSASIQELRNGTQQILLGESDI